jgi:hypothetical protein
MADAALTAVRPYASPDHARIDLPGPASRSGHASDGLEGFARTFLLAAFRLSADGDTDPDNLAQWYATGLAAGTDPANPNRWPRLTEVNQAKVECASIALALHETRPWIWDRLDDQVQQRIIDWMAPMNGTPVWNNNWVWFAAVTEAFLRSVGAPVRVEDIERAISRTDEWYAGDGWYSDGSDAGGTFAGESQHPGWLRNFDYYNGWAMHFYPLWYCRISGEQADPTLLPRYRERLRRFLTDAQHLVGTNGAPLFQGRSLTYRYAMLAPFWAGAIFDATPLAPGLTRRLASGVVGHFVRNGAFDEQGRQTLGWHHEFQQIRQPYSGPGSPYWSSKGFAGLVLPADHPVWTAVEEPMALERGDVEVTLVAPGWVVSGTSADGIVRVTNHGGDHAHPERPALDDAFYARYAFASHAAPELSKAARSAPLDSHVALITEDGRVSHRRPSLPVRIDGRIGISRHRAHWPVDDGDKPEFQSGPWLTTASVLRGAVEVRLVRVDPAEPDAEGGTPAHHGPWRLRLGGWAIAGDEPPVPLPAGVTGVRRDDGLTSVLTDLAGLPTGGLDRAEDGNPFGRQSAVPWIGTDGPVAFGKVYAAAVVLRRDSGGDAAAQGVSLNIDHDDRGAVVRVLWPDGGLDELRLDPATSVTPAGAAGPTRHPLLDSTRRL